MKFILHISLIIILFKISFLGAQNFKNVPSSNYSDIIYWSDTTKLKWVDFKKTNNKRTFLAATSVLGIEMKMKISNGKVCEYYFLPYFSRNESWSNSDDNYLLKHEQLHFDIEEIFARKMRKKAIELKLKNKILKRSDLNKIYRYFNSQKKEAQEKYDIETNHSRINYKQNQWNTKVAKELDELKNFNL